MKRGVLLALLLLTLCIGGYTFGPGPENMPIPRLIGNLKAAIQKKPKEAENYYLLGRVNYFAFVAPRDKTQENDPQAQTLAVYGGGRQFDDWWGGDKQGKSKAPGPACYKRSNKAQIAHVRAAVVNLNRAMAMRGEHASPKSPDSLSYSSSPGLFELCLACALEDGAPYAPKVGALSGLNASSKAWLTAAIQNYWLAFDRAETNDLKDRPGFHQTLVSEEAGASYKRLLTARGDITATEKSRLSRIATTLATLSKRPRAVTPIVFSLKPGVDGRTVVQRSRAMRFDLDGTGMRILDSWPAPETAILVWDPKRTGKITSGVQLFGSSTFWLFWKDGYAAMASLDDNGDGWLSGKELKGLALWQDRNSNGISDPGEVTPIEATNVAAISVNSTGTDGGFTSNSQGLRLKNGSVLPTWDWVATARR
ncbi:MAG: hypothetical protein QM758_16670 [Armatimonas sp.]